MFYLHSLSGAEHKTLFSTTLSPEILTILNNNYHVLELRKQRTTGSELERNPMKRLSEVGTVTVSCDRLRLGLAGELTCPST